MRRTATAHGGQAIHVARAFIIGNSWPVFWVAWLEAERLVLLGLDLLATQYLDEVAVSA